jgi:hypothetical protein
MSEDSVARVVGAVYLAALYGLERASATAMNDYLRAVSLSPHMGKDEKRFLAFLAETANRPAKQGPQFEVIPGGLSA